MSKPRGSQPSSQQRKSIQDIELRSPCSPRSIVAFQSASRGTHVLFGTERGSLHYRSYVIGKDEKGVLTYAKRFDESVVSSGGAIMDIVMGSSVSVGNSNVVFCILVDDLKYNSATSMNSGSLHDRSFGSKYHHSPYSIDFMVFKNGQFFGTERRRNGQSSQLVTQSGGELPRVSSIAYHPSAGFVYTSECKLRSLCLQNHLQNLTMVGSTSSASDLSSFLPAPVVYYDADLTALATNCSDNNSSNDAGSLSLVCQGRVAVLSSGNSFYAVPSAPGKNAETGENSHIVVQNTVESTQIVTFSQSEQMHAPVVAEINTIADPNTNLTISRRAMTTMIFLALGRNCTACELLYDARHASVMLATSNTIASLSSPIMDASTSSTSNRPLVAVLTSDGLIHIRSPSCLAVPLSIIESRILAASYSGDGRIVTHHVETSQEQADRMMKLAIDAFGPNNFPRTQLAESIGATFSATSYIGPDPSDQARIVLRQYLSSLLGLASEVGDISSWLEEDSTVLSDSSRQAHLVTGTALLCYACAMVKPSHGSLASRAAKLCANKVTAISSQLSESIVGVCEHISDHILKMVSASCSPLTDPAKNSVLGMEFVEASLWLLRCCGSHERAISVLKERMENPNRSGGWSYAKYERYTATLLQELWSSGDGESAALVLKSTTTKKILEVNPRLGLSIFTNAHPRGQQQWKDMKMIDDPLIHSIEPLKVVDRLKSITPLRGFSQGSETKENYTISSDEGAAPLTLNSGLALAVTFLESAFGLSSDRTIENDAFSALPGYNQLEERAHMCHDELVYLLIEGSLAEAKKSSRELDFAQLYQAKLRRFLSWPLAKFRAERILASLPSSYLREHALLLGRLGRHDEALRILYCDLNSLDLALKYCDMLHLRQKIKNGSQSLPRSDTDCAYLPLVKVALESNNSDEGTASAISIISKRRDIIDSSAALRLLPGNIPLAAIARPFLIPTLIEQESEVRRLQIASSLLRAQYVNLKRSLTNAQLASQSNFENVEALQLLDMGDIMKSSNLFVARSSGSPSPSFPNVTLIKHFFLKHLVIEARVSNTPIDARALSNITFVVAESSDETAVAPVAEVPIKTLPIDATGSSWCALTVVPQRLDGAISLTCELRYTILPVDATTGAPVTFVGKSHIPETGGRTFVEELQEIEVRHSEFKYY